MNREFDDQTTRGHDDYAVARRARVTVRADELDHAEWERARPVSLTRYWSGAAAPPARHAEARVLWDDEGLTVRFVCEQREPLIVCDAPRTNEKTIGLWDRDVCEIFLAPDASRPERYFEFEVAPTGEWLDLALLWHGPGARDTDWEFRSGMEAAARIEGEKITSAMRLRWAPMLSHEWARAEGREMRAPRAGERWRANFYRCIGADLTRGYLAWSPTETPEPGFHAPHKFGWLVFEE